MMSLRRPSAVQIESYRTARMADEPTTPSAAEPPAGYRHDAFHRTIGDGTTFERACEGLTRWAPHRHASVEPFPHDTPLEVGTTIGLLMRQPGLWILVSCRIETVIDEPDRFGFVYATLPGHLVDGYESFVVTRHDDEVTFTVDMVSRPASPVIRAAGPIARILQHRAVDAYLTGLERWVQAGS